MRRIKWVGVMSLMTISLYAASHDERQVSETVGTEIDYRDLVFSVDKKPMKIKIKDFGYATRYLARYKDKEYFITELNPEYCLDEKIGQEVKEKLIQASQLNHPHVVSLEGYSLEIDLKEEISPFYMTEKREFTLEDYFKIEDKIYVSRRELIFKTVSYSLRERLSILRQIVAGLQYLQSKNVRFIPTPYDIIFERQSPATVKITNYWSFPLLKRAQPREDRRMGAIYMAPEIYKDENADPFVFGLAMLMWEILYQNKIDDLIHFPIEMQTQSFVEQGIRPSVEKKPMDWPVEKEESWKRLAFVICKAWAHNPADRATLEEIDKVIERVLVVDFETPKDAT